MGRAWRWCRSGVVEAFLVCSLAVSQTPVLCMASGTPRRSNGNEKSVGAHHRPLQQDPHEVPFDVAGRSLASDEPDPASSAPEQVHISLALSDSLEEYAMTVAWSTWPETRSQVIWGSSPHKQDRVVFGSSTSYRARHPGRADYTSGFLHSATLEGLKPSSTYYFSCGDDTLAMSSVRSFVTPHKIGPEQQITFGVLGDLGQTEDSAATLSAMDDDPSLDLVLHAGDLSYADCDQPRWDSFMRMLDPIASRLPWMVAAGNHEIETNGGYNDTKPFLAYEHRFRMPAVKMPAQVGYTCGTGGGLDGNGGVCGEGFGDEEAEEAASLAMAKFATVGTRGGVQMLAGKTVGASVRQTARETREAFDAHGTKSQLIRSSKREDGMEEENKPSCCPSEWSGTYDYGNSFYSFDVGPAHVVVLNPYTATGEGSEQVVWLQKDLEATDRTLTPWLVVMMHCPWYNSNLAHQGERQAETAMRAIEPLLHHHKAAVVIAGHVHAYERSYPVVDFELTEDGPIYLVVGGAGNREGHAANFYPSPEWSAFREGMVFGSGRLSIQSSSLALWQWTSSEEGVGVDDSAWISNPFSHTPGDAQEDGTPTVAVTEGDGSDGVIGFVSRESQDDGKTGIRAGSGHSNLAARRSRHFA